jgi:dihydrolipoamide dehydrogenase
VKEIEFDVVVIGGGSGGTPGANLLAKKGLKVALVEKGRGLGGTCLFEGCIPSKIYIESASRYNMLHEMKDFGIEGSFDFKVDFRKIKSRKEEILKARTERASKGAAKNHLNVFYGLAKISGPDTVDVNGKDGDLRLKFKKLIMATGSEGVRIPIKGNDLCLSVEDIFELEEKPESMVVIGGGYIGVEMASMLRRVDTKVTIIELLPRLLSTEDVNVSIAVAEGLQNSGIDIHVNSKVISVEKSDDGFAVRYSENGEEKVAYGQKVLMAAGRKPRTDGIDLGMLGIEKGKRGEIPVNDYMQTINEDVYAPGDVNGKLMLAHAATVESLTAAYKILGKDVEINYNAIPHAIFSDPESSSVGIDSTKGKEMGYEVFRYPYSEDAKALIMGDKKGFVQFVVEPQSHKLMGAQIVGKEASELIAGPTQVIKMNGTIEDITSCVYTHPTLSEVVFEAAESALSLLDKKQVAKTEKL